MRLCFGSIYPKILAAQNWCVGWNPTSGTRNSSMKARYNMLNAINSNNQNGVVETILQRTEPLFDDDWKTHQHELSEVVDNGRVLRVGAAGPIGISFVHHISTYQLTALYPNISKIDLVEIVRFTTQRCSVAGGFQDPHHRVRRGGIVDYL